MCGSARRPSSAAQATWTGVSAPTDRASGERSLAQLQRKRLTASRRARRIQQACAPIATSYTRQLSRLVWLESVLKPVTHHFSGFFGQDMPEANFTDGKVSRELYQDGTLVIAEVALHHTEVSGGAREPAL